jgi:hypothetical protein
MVATELKLDEGIRNAKGARRKTMWQQRLNSKRSQVKE